MNGDEVRQLIRQRMEEANAALEDARYLLAGQRSAQGIVNRVYYAMFYAVLALLQSIGAVPSKHAGAVALFDREFVLKGVFPREMSRHLHRAFELRQVSDYHTTKSLSQETITELLDEASAFVAAVADYLAQPQNEG